MRTGVVVSARVLCVSVLLLWASGVQAKQNECDGLYYGFGGPKDLEAAYECYAERAADPENEESYETVMQVLMILNGEGTDDGLDLAEEILRRAHRLPGHRTIWGYAGSVSGVFRQEGLEQIELFEVFVHERRTEAAPAEGWPKLVYCDAIIGRGELECPGILSAVAEANDDNLAAAVRAKLPRGALASFERLRRAFEAYEEQETERILLAWHGGSGAGVAAGLHQQTVRDRFNATCRRILLEGDIVAPDSQPLGQKHSRIAQLVDQAKEPQMEVIWGQEPEYQKRMRARWTKVADGTQQTWKKYRGAWIALIRELFSPSEVDGAVKRFRQLLASQRLKDLGWSEGR